MVKKKKISKKKTESSGESLDDAFADDSDVVYAESKPRKEKKKGLSEDELEKEIDDVEEEEKEIGKAINGADSVDREITFKVSKPAAKIKKGDKIKIDSIEYEVDEHYLLMDHGTTKEMAIEIFNPKTDKDFQLRYFNDQVESTIELYELREIMYFKKPFKKIEW